MELIRLRKLLTHHPHSIGETYFEHFRFACFSGLRLVFAGFACMIHSVLPFLFINTASQTIQEITEEITVRKNKTP